MLATGAGTHSIVFDFFQSKLANDVGAQDIAIFRMACEVFLTRFLIDHRFQKSFFVDLGEFL